MAYGPFMFTQFQSSPVYGRIIAKLNEIGLCASDEKAETWPFLVLKEGGGQICGKQHVYREITNTQPIHLTGFGYIFP